MAKNKLLPLGIVVACVIAMVSFTTYANSVGRDLEREARMKRYNAEVREKAKLISDQIILAIRQNMALRSEKASAASKDMRIEELINFERLSERKDTADFLKVDNAAFYEENVIQPAKSMLENIWVDVHKKNGPIKVCDLGKPDLTCYPDITKNLEELTNMQKKLVELKERK